MNNSNSAIKPVISGRKKCEFLFFQDTLNRSVEFTYRMVFMQANGQPTVIGISDEYQYQ